MFADNEFSSCTSLSVLLYLWVNFSPLGCKEHLLEDGKSDPVSDTTDLALPPEMPILIDFHALKDILGPPMYEMEVSILVSSLIPTC